LTLQAQPYSSPDFVSDPQGWSFPRKEISLQGGEVHVWLAGLDLGQDANATAASIVTPEETSRFANFLDPERRNRAVVSRGILRSILSIYTGLEPEHLDIRSQHGGKPYIAGGPRFSLSHSGRLALYAFSEDREVGVDIEVLGLLKDPSGMASRFLPEGAQAQLLEVPGPDRALCFHKSWTTQEALLKGLGRGLSSLQSKPDERETKGWSVVDLQVPLEAVASLAYSGHGARVKQWRFMESLLPPRLPKLPRPGKIVK
jgi:4'-phosphopantetheinyl transferase